MKFQFTFLSGTRAGQIDVFGQPFITLGRHPLCELKFDPDKDLDVSSRHASVTLENGVFLLRDLESTNGTFVNGSRLRDSHMLADKDVIQFGPNGPKVQFNLLQESGAQSTRSDARPARGASPGTALFPSAASDPTRNPPPPRATSGGVRASPGSEGNAPKAPPGPRPGRGAAGAGGGKGGHTTRIRAEVARETAHLRRTTIGLFALLLVVSGAYLWQSISSARQLEGQRRLLLGQVDSLIRQIDALSVSQSVLKAALDSARSTTARLRRELDQGTQTSAELEAIRRQLGAAMQRQKNLSQAARLDAGAIAAANQDAIALVFAQFKDGKTYTGTAFAVRSDPNGGLLLTNRHVVTDSAGVPAMRIGIVFNGSNQNFKADIAAVHPDQDVVSLRVSVHRGVPVVKGLAPGPNPVAVGDPVAVLGFPLGLDLPQGRDWRSIGVSATLTLGTASRVLPQVLQLDSYGAQGASGSPIFNRDGLVVGILYGGEKSSNGRIVFGVPIRFGQQVLGQQ
jgi:S1-C subfamily serine protease